MEQPEKKLSEKESLDLITSMINKAKDSYHDTGIGPIMWGSVVIICSLITYAEIVFKFELPFDIWLLTLAAIIPQIIISYRENKSKKVRNYNEIAMDYVWITFGVSIFLLIHTNAGIYRGLEKGFGDAVKTSSFQFYDYTTPLFLIIYGFPTFVTGGIMKFKPMLFGGIFCWVCSVLAVYTPPLTDLLLMAASAFFAWLLPGILINRNCRKKRMAADV
jgi:uncharacterized protein with PQ loop repeat